MERKSLAEKVIVLGVDGMDPKICKRFLDEDKLPNIKKMLAMGAAREDLMMLGGVPTITPPMWTTLSTGAYPMTHGVTCYFNTDGVNLGKLVNNFDSAQVKAEQIWEVTAKAGKKTSVYKGYKRDKIEMRGDRAEMSDFPLYLNTVAGRSDCQNQNVSGFSFVVKIYAVPVVEIIR